MIINKYLFTFLILTFFYFILLIELLLHAFFDGSHLKLIGWLNILFF